jgi:hypothetical protein
MEELPDDWVIPEKTPGAEADVVPNRSSSVSGLAPPDGVKVIVFPVTD